MFSLLESLGRLRNQRASSMRVRAEWQQVEKGGEEGILERFQQGYSQYQQYKKYLNNEEAIPEGLSEEDIKKEVKEFEELGMSISKLQKEHEALNTQRKDALRDYNESTRVAERNAQLVGNKGLSAAAAALRGMNKLSPDSAFLDNMILGNWAHLEGMLGGGFSGENQQLDTQKALDKAVQEKFMRQNVREGNRALEGINRQSEVLGGTLTDQAIGNRNSYYAQEAAIQGSGIEGSGNMSRNASYGRGRDEASRQLQYDMITDQGLGVGRSMADNFDQLVQSQEQNTLSTLINPVQFDMAGAMQASNDLWMKQPSIEDYDKASGNALPNAGIDEIDALAKSLQGSNAKDILNEILGIFKPVTGK